ncbi:MAG: glycosyltransferase family 2 protein [Ginsengibacter sp.]
MISVIIPCHNCEKSIARAIESVLSQIYVDYEIILVNNNSSDNTIGVINDYKKNYPSIIRILHENKKGASAARNKGLYEAKGEWIQYLDADDELMPDKLGRQLKILIENTADIIAGCFIRVKMEKTKLRQTVVMPDTKDVWLSLISSNLGRTSSILWKRQTLIAVNGWNEMLSSSQEYDLLFRALKRQAKICFDTKPSTFIYISTNSISNSIDKERNSQIFSNWLKLRLAIKGYLKENGFLNNEINQAIDIVIFDYLRHREHLSPNYVTNKLRNLTLDLPFNLKLKRFLVLQKFKMISIIKK